MIAFVANMTLNIRATVKKERDRTRGIKSSLSCKPKIYTHDTIVIMNLFCDFVYTTFKDQIISKISVDVSQKLQFRNLRIS